MFLLQVFLLIIFKPTASSSPRGAWKAGQLSPKGTHTLRFLVGKSSSDPKMAGERRWWFFPQLDCWKKKKVPQPLRRYLGWRAFLQMNPGFQMGSFPCFEEWTLKKQGASSKVWVPMSPGWDFWFITDLSHWIGIPSGALNQCLLKILTDCSTSSEGKIKSPVANHWLHETRNTLADHQKCTPPSLTY